MILCQVSMPVVFFSFLALLHRGILLIPTRSSIVAKLRELSYCPPLGCTSDTLIHCHTFTSTWHKNIWSPFVYTAICNFYFYSETVIMQILNLIRWKNIKVEISALFNSLYDSERVSSWLHKWEFWIESYLTITTTALLLQIDNLLCDFYLPVLSRFLFKKTSTYSSHFLFKKTCLCLQHVFGS